MKPRFNKLALTALLALTMTNCNIVYKSDIQQGNEITREMALALSTGMTKQEVTNLLGSPLISDPFHKERWDYYYFFKSGKSGKTKKQTLTLQFQNDRLVHLKSTLNH